METFWKRQVAAGSQIRPTAEPGKWLSYAVRRRMATDGEPAPEPGGLEVPSSNLGAPTKGKASDLSVDSSDDCTFWYTQATSHHCRIPRSREATTARIFRSARQ
jgi:hypothetical protein